VRLHWLQVPDPASSPPLPELPGSYGLLIDIPGWRSVSAGRLGTVCFPPGWYIYVGNACGPGGVRARVARHLRRDKTIFWHIDRLLAETPVSAVWWQTGAGPLECVWAARLAALPGSMIPARGFGSSDCRSGCAAHLMRLPDGPTSGWTQAPWEARDERGLPFPGALLELEELVECIQGTESVDVERSKLSQDGILR